MPDYSAYHTPGQVVTMGLAGRVMRGEPVMVVGQTPRETTVARFRAGGEYVGIATRHAAPPDR